MTTRWLFGDQLGPHFLDGSDQPVLMVEARGVFARRRFHRAKAQLVLSAMRHRAAELGDQCTYVRASSFAEALDGCYEPLSVCHPTSHAALRFVHGRGDIEVVPARGFATSTDDFQIVSPALPQDLDRLDGQPARRRAPGGECR